MDKDNDQLDSDFQALSGGPYPLDSKGDSGEAYSASLPSPLPVDDPSSAEDYSKVGITLSLSDVTIFDDTPSVTAKPVTQDTTSVIEDGPSIPSTYVGAVTSTANTNIVDVTVNLIGTPGGLLPSSSTEVTGIYVYVNGVRRDVITAKRRDGMFDGDAGIASQKQTIRIWLKYPIQYGDEVQVSYFSTTVSADRIRDTAGNNLAYFYNLNALNTTPSPYFDLLAWIKSPQDGYEFSTELLNSDLHELREGWPLAKTLLDTVPPIGISVINDNPSLSGLSVHWFMPFQDVAGTIQVPGNLLVKDNLDRTIRRGGTLGGFASPDVYETIGDLNCRSIVRMFSPGLNGSYPKVKKIEFCLTADKPRQYLLEIKKQPSDLWTPVMSMIAKEDSLDYFRCQFAPSDGEPLAAARIRACGDYYATAGTGDLTVSAFDEVSGTTGIRASHFSDMRDALDFSPNTDFNGWLDFDDGTSLFDWNLINLDRVWCPFRWSDTSDGTFGLGVFNSKLYRYDGSNLYLISARNALAQTLLTLSLVDGSFTGFEVHKGALFVTTSSGATFKSLNGVNFELIDSPELQGKTTLASYKDLLYIGGSDTNGNGLLYTWNGTTRTLIRQFKGLRIVSMTVGRGKLFVGLSGGTSSNAGAVHYYDSTSWTSTLAAEADSVDVLQYANGVVWAGVTGGILHVANFDIDGNLTSWETPPQAIDCNIFNHIREDNDFVWFATDNGLYAYHKTTLTFIQVTKPPMYPSGLNAVYTESNLLNIRNTGLVIGQQENEVVSTLTIGDMPAAYNALFSPDVTNYVNASFTGYIRAPFTDTYTFTLTTVDGGRLYLGGQGNSTTWTNGTLLCNDWEVPLVGSVTGTAHLIAGQLVPIRVEWYQITPSTGSLQLQWECSSLPQEDVPSDALFTSNVSSSRNTINDIAVVFGETIGGSINGALYELDATDLITHRRRVYVEFKDGAGNTSKNAIEVATDTIFQDADPSNIEAGLGRIHQVATDKTVIATFQSDVRKALYAPNRQVREYGIYESIPYYVSSLTRWDTISILGLLPAGVDQELGLEKGTSIEVYIRSDDTKAETLAKEYSEPFVKTSIAPGSDVGVINSSFNIGDFTGKWLQFKIRIGTASLNVTPTVNAVTLSYKAAGSSYFFSSVLDTSLESSESPSPLWRRGLFTANMIPNGGFVQYGYTTNMEASSTFDYSLYTQIEPNSIFTLPEPSSRIRFGIMIVSVNGSTPAIVDDFAVQLEAAKTDMKLMD